MRRYLRNTCQQTACCVGLTATLLIAPACGGKGGGDSSNLGGVGAVCASDPSAVLVQSIAIGGSHTCVVTAAGGVRCWGVNSILYGQLGDGTANNANAPPKEDLITGVSAIAAGWVHTCALASGVVRCWGGNEACQLGSETPKDPNTGKRMSPRPLTVSELSDVTAIAAGYEHTCALTQSHDVSCWGGNSYGQRGDSTTEFCAEPKLNALLSNVAAIAAGDLHTCATVSMEDGKGSTVRCWGNNILGQLGRDTGKTVKNPSPLVVEGLPDTSAISAGGYHTCALSNGSVYCWGSNSSGQLGGDCKAAMCRTPLSVPDLTSVTAIAAGTEHTCALIDGDVRCWGKNDKGQLGVGYTSDPQAPSHTRKALIDVPAIAITASGDVTCARTARGGVRCWGGNANCQIGHCWEDAATCQVGSSDNRNCLTPAVPDGLCGD